MSLLTRLVAPQTGELKLPSHQFMAAIAEYKRGAPGVTLASIATTFGLSAGEQTDLATLAGLFVGDVISRELIHDVLLLGEVGIYSVATCQARILTAGTPDLTAVLLQAKSDAVRIGLNDLTLSGCAVSPQGSPNMTLAVAKGAVWTSGVLRAVAAGNVTIGAADANLGRLDLVVVTTAGAKAVRQGTPAASPQIGGYQGGDVPLALVYVPPGTTAIDSSHMMDVRIVRSRGPITCGQIATATVVNNNAGQVVYIDMTIPSGLFLAGKVIRVRCGGTMLLNSGTPTVRLQVAYGGTMMFDDITGASVADTDRIAWMLDFNLVAQANNDQALNGSLQIGPVSGARTAPTVGVGDIAVPALLAGTSQSSPLNGSAAVDSDAGDQHLQVAWTMSVANAQNEIVMEYATAEVM
jgi:hypothetical protein